MARRGLNKNTKCELRAEDRAGMEGVEEREGVRDQRECYEAKIELRGITIRSGWKL